LPVAMGPFRHMKSSYPRARKNHPSIPTPSPARAGGVLGHHRRPRQGDARAREVRPVRPLRSGRGDATSSTPHLSHSTPPPLGAGRSSRGTGGGCSTTTPRSSSTRWSWRTPPARCYPPASFLASPAHIHQLGKLINQLADKTHPLASQISLRLPFSLGGQSANHSSGIDPPPPRSRRSGPGTARVVQVLKREKRRWRPFPLNTVELQKLAARHLRPAPGSGITALVTMRA